MCPKMWLTLRNGKINRRLSWFLRKWLRGVLALILFSTGFLVRDMGREIPTAEYEPEADWHSGKFTMSGNPKLPGPYHQFKPNESFEHSSFALERAPSDLQKIKALQRNWIVNHKRPPDSAYNMNVTASEVLSLDREIEDTRPRACLSRTASGSELSAASIIIPFHNEALSVLLRTIHSILNRTPGKRLEEILLVDDFSSHDYLKDPLDNYVSLLPKVKPVIRTGKREGLIRSRLIGADRAHGRVLVFLDAHTECNVGWLEPLLEEIQKRRDVIAQPFVDGIDPGTMAYESPKTIYRGAFTWDLR